MKKSLRIGYDCQNYSYLTHVLGKMGVTPDDRYKLSPVYRFNWSMTEAGRLLNEPVDQWETALKTEIKRLEGIPEILERLRIQDEERLQNDPHVKVLNAKIEGLKTAIAPPYPEGKVKNLTLC